MYANIRMCVQLDAASTGFRYNKTFLRWPPKISIKIVKKIVKRKKDDLRRDKWYLHENRKYCRMISLEHSAILLTCIK